MNENSTAFGAPGIEPRWTSSAKDGIGTAYHNASCIWFTLSHGIVNEIYFPHVDSPNTRDMVQTATALLACGQTESALRALIWLACVQATDGSLPQISSISGEAYWKGIQLDEVAVPILLAWRLQQEDGLRQFDPWTLVSRAARYLILHGPVTAQERWEENSGYSPSMRDLVAGSQICHRTSSRPTPASSSHCCSKRDGRGKIFRWRLRRRIKAKKHLENRIMNVLAIDTGGTHVKILATGGRTHREFPSGPTLTARRMVAAVKKLAGEWKYNVGIRGLKQHGKKRWRRPVVDVVARLIAALEPTDVVLGGGNVNNLKKLPPGCRTGDNAKAFIGGFRLWANVAGGRRRNDA